MPSVIENADVKIRQPTARASAHVNGAVPSVVSPKDAPAKALSHKQSLSKQVAILGSLKLVVRVRCTSSAGNSVRAFFVTEGKFIKEACWERKQDLCSKDWKQRKQGYSSMHRGLL